MDAQQYIDALLGGLESALARGQPLQKAMISFYNAGYEKRDIEDAARKFQEMHQKRFEELGVEPEPAKKVIKTSVSEYKGKSIKEPVKVVSSEPKLKSFKSEIVPQQEDKREELPRKIKQEKNTQVVSKYGEDSFRQNEEFKKAIMDAISNIKGIPVYQKEKSQKPIVIQKVSDYGMQSPTPVSKAITFLLIFLLLLLLGLLGAVFFFKEELIELFNSLSIQ